MRPVVQRPILIWLFAILGLGAGSAQAQATPDSITTTLALADSDTTIKAPVSADSAATLLHSFSDEPYSTGALLDSIPPARGYYLDQTAALADVPGAFSYSLGNLGWPHQWTYLGMPPSAVELSVDGMTMRDPTTNRALFDAVQIDLIDTQRESALAHGGPVTLQSRLRPLAVARPYTELRYENGSAGLQSISAMHVQQRKWQILGAPTVTQFVGRFGFHEWTGRYPNSGSDLSQAFGRIGFTSRRWRVRFTNSYSLRTRGAHSGVQVKPGEGFDSVYDTFDATVGDPSATQRQQRNQFDISVEHTWEADLKPLAISSSYTKWLYRYTNGADSETRSSEFRLKIEQETPEFVRGHEMTGRFSLEFVDLGSDSLLAGGGGATKSRMIASADDQFSLGRLVMHAIIGIHAVDKWAYPSAGLQIQRAFERFSLAAEASLNGRAPSPLEKSGGLGVTVAEQDLAHTESQSIRLAFDLPGEVLGIKVTAFVSRLIDPVDIVRASEGSYLVGQSSGAVTRTGMTASLAWRVLSRRGFYGTVSPTVQSASVSNHDELADGLASSLPDFVATARFGYRNQFFGGDLDADLFVLGRFWSAFKSRRYDPVHALLVLPGAEEPEYSGSGTLDVRGEADIRGTTLFVSVDNVLAGFVYPGTLIVPVYPIPSQAFRFGVFWPIDD